MLQVKKGLWLKGEYRTLESILRNAEAYAREGMGDRGRLMQHFNCEFPVGLFNQTFKNMCLLVR